MKKFDECDVLNYSHIVPEAKNNSIIGPMYWYSCISVSLFYSSLHGAELFFRDC